MGNLENHIHAAISDVFGLPITAYQWRLPTGGAEPVMEGWPEGADFGKGPVPPWPDARSAVETRADEMASDALRLAVNAERDRRIAAGATFPVPGYGDVPLTGRAFDMVVYEAQRTRAREAQDAGVSGAVIVLRDANNVNHMLTPTQAVALFDAATAWVQAVMQASWAMKDGMAPFEAGIPADYRGDRHWPPPSSA